MTSHNHKLRTHPFGDPLTRMSGPGPGQWVAKTHPNSHAHAARHLISLTLEEALINAQTKEIFSNIICL